MGVNEDQNTPFIMTVSHKGRTDVVSSLRQRVYRSTMSTRIHAVAVVGGNKKIAAVCNWNNSQAQS